MNVHDLRADLDVAAEGQRVYELIAELYPILRSRTGPGVRQTLDRLGRDVDLDRHEVPSGTPIFDWVVPDEWAVREAWIRAPDGRLVADITRSNLHLVGYSRPFRGRLTLDELRPHLHTIPEQPDRIAYLTGYYSDDWGFSIRHADYEALADGEYEVVVDTTLGPGSMTIGEWYKPGATADEIFISTHTCHPSLCNDNLSGVVVAAELARLLAGVETRYSYRIAFVPSTTGALTWLKLHEDGLERIAHGLVLSNLGDSGHFHYKESRREDATIDRVAAHVLASHGEHEVRRWMPFGYDERQYCAPGFDLPVGSLSRTPHHRYPEYHTDADDLSYVHPRQLGDSVDLILEIIDVLERDRRPVNLSPKGEPQLGAHGLYRAIGGRNAPKELELAIFWVLSLGDGSRTLLDIAERSGMAFDVLSDAADALVSAGLVADVSG
jgi:aminopeptidase-like protein